MVVLFSGLFLQQTEVNAALVDAHGSARLHSVYTNAPASDAFREMRHGRFGNASSRHHAASNMHQSVEERACRHHYAFRPELHAPYRFHAHRHSAIVLCGFKSGVIVFLVAVDVAARLHEEFVGLVLPDVESIDVVERLAPLPDELLAVALCTRTPHRRTLAAVEHAKLYGSSIGDVSHFAAESI